MTGRLTVLAPDGVPEVAAGADLAALLLDALAAAGEALADGDVVVVTSKVVSKAEGRVRPGDREAALAGETARVVARRGPTTIVRTHHGLTMAAAGIDASNVARGQVVLLPVDPDASAARFARRPAGRTDRHLGVVVTDTAGRAWREGQTDIAVGAAGLRVLEDYAGRHDAHGNELAVTAPAVADELAGAAELAQGKLAGRPFAVVRGRADLLLPPADDGPGARALVRREGGDLFGYGAREAVVTALVGDPATSTPYGSAVGLDELAAVLARVAGAAVVTAGGGERLLADDGPRGEAGLLAVACFAHGWRLVAAGPRPDGRPGLELRVSPAAVEPRP